MTRYGVGIDGLARQRIGHEDRPIRRRRYAIAAMSDIRNDQPVDHRRCHARLLPGRARLLLSSSEDAPVVIVRPPRCFHRMVEEATGRRTMNLFVIAAGLMAAAHVVAALQRPRLAVIVSGILWALYAYYEYLIATGVLCDANCNIRVDLVLFFPILGLATFWAYQSYMGRQGPQKVVRHCSRRHRPVRVWAGGGGLRLWRFRLRRNFRCSGDRHRLRDQIEVRGETVVTPLTLMRRARHVRHVAASGQDVETRSPASPHR